MGRKFSTDAAQDQEELSENKVSHAVAELISMTKKINDTRLKKQWMKVKELSDLSNRYHHVDDYREELLKLCNQLSLSIDGENCSKNNIFEIYKIYSLLDVSFRKQADLIQMKHDVYRLKATIILNLRSH